MYSITGYTVVDLTYGCAHKNIKIVSTKTLGINIMKGYERKNSHKKSPNQSMIGAF